jgi:hypothetical protein
MFLAALLFALLVGFIFSLLLGYGFRRRPAGIGFLPLFLVIFLVTWAIGIWIAPFGPVAWEIPWLAFLIIGLFFALVVAAFAAPERTSSKVRLESQGETQVQAGAAGVFLWLLVAGLAIAVAARYVWA